MTALPNYIKIFVIGLIYLFKLCDNRKKKIKIKKKKKKTHPGQEKKLKN